MSSCPAAILSTNAETLHTKYGVLPLLATAWAVLRDAVLTSSSSVLFAWGWEQQASPVTAGP
jgi:hypothetical protein